MSQRRKNLGLLDSKRPLKSEGHGAVRAITPQRSLTETPYSAHFALRDYGVLAIATSRLGRKAEKPGNV